MKKIAMIFASLAVLVSAWIQPVQAQEAFVIDELDIHMKVEEDGTYLVEERYTLDFDEYRHGFYRTIPTKYEMRWVDEDTGSTTTKNYYFPVDQLSCGKAQCETEYKNNDVVLKIGDPDRTVIGKQNYVISYRVHTKDLDYQDTQMLYWNLIGNGFDTKVRHMTYTIDMPKTFDETRISAYTGGFKEAFENLSYEVNGTSITGELLEPLYNYEGATIMVHLPSDYFTFPEPTNYLLYGMIASIAVLIVSGLLFLRFGKDDDVVITVEFQAPDGLDSAAVGYVADATVDNRDILSLIIDWANRGYLHIHEEEGHHITLEKLKDLDSAETKAYERSLFDAIFRQKNLVSEDDLKDMHVADGLSSAKTMLSNYFHVKKRRVYTSSSMPLQVLMCFFVALPTLLCVFAVFYMHYGMLGMAIPSIVLGAVAAFVQIPWIVLMRKRYVMKKSTFFLCFGLMILLNAVIFTIGAIFLFLWGPQNSWIYVILYLVIELILLLIMMFMDKRTPQGNRWLGQILGLREFILTCEKDRLEMLVEENPSAFYQILPYAYVLGVSDVWAKKFEDLFIPAPEWYMSSYYGSHFTAWIWWSSFHHSFQSMSNAASYVEPKGSSGVGGGSFGGFGGGGFSGGGFGGGGGGSW